MLAHVIKHFWTTSQKAEATAVPSIPQQPEPLTETVLPAVDVTVKTVGGASPDEASAALRSQPSPIPEAGSLRRPTAELAPQTTTPEPLQSGRAGSEPKVSSDRCWTPGDPGSAQLRLTRLKCCCRCCLSTYQPAAALFCRSLAFRPACLLTTVLPRRERCLYVCVCVCARANQRISNGVIGGRSLPPLLSASAWL